MPTFASLYTYAGNYVSANGAAWAWYGRVGARMVVSGAIAGAAGSDAGKAMLMAGFTAGAAELYTSFVGSEATWRPGENRANPSPCGPGASCYVESTGRIPESFGNGNSIGTNTPLVGEFIADFHRQSGPVSTIFNLIPGFNSFSRFHDTFYFGQNALMFHSTNFPTMIPALFVNYGALLDGTTLSYEQFREQQR